MKCFYAIPKEAVGKAEAFCREYARQLESFSESAISGGDNLRAFAESAGGPSLQLDDDDWEAIKSDISEHSQKARRLVGEIFWSCDDVRDVTNILNARAVATGAVTSAAEGWLKTQMKRERGVVLLAR